MFKSGRPSLPERRLRWKRGSEGENDGFLQAAGGGTELRTRTGRQPLSEVTTCRFPLRKKGKFHTDSALGMYSCNCFYTRPRRAKVGVFPGIKSMT